MQRKPNEIGPLEKRSLPHVGFFNEDDMVWFSDADAIDKMIADLQVALIEARKDPERTEILVYFGSYGCKIYHRYPDRETDKTQ